MSKASARSYYIMLMGGVAFTSSWPPPIDHTCDPYTRQMPLAVDIDLDMAMSRVSRLATNINLCAPMTDFLRVIGDIDPSTRPWVSRMSRRTHRGQRCWRRNVVVDGRCSGLVGHRRGDWRIQRHADRSLAMLPTAFPGGIVGDTYAAAAVALCNAAGGGTWSISGAVPSWLTINPATGVVWGNHHMTTYNFNVKYTEGGVIATREQQIHRVRQSALATAVQRSGRQHRVHRYRRQGVDAAKAMHRSTRRSSTKAQRLCCWTERAITSPRPITRTSRRQGSFRAEIAARMTSVAVKPSRHFVQQAASGKQQTSFALLPDDGRIQVTAFDGVGTSVSISTPVNMIVDNTWVHVAVERIEHA